MAEPKVTTKSDIMIEAEWETELLHNALGEALQPDGSIDFDKLDDLYKTVELEELYPEGEEDDEA